ncbi:MAG: methyltransferase domain-containing protein [Myxococcota bacterium]
MSPDLSPIDPTTAGFVDIYDQLPLWSAPFGLRLLELVPLLRGQRILDLGCGTGFLSVELAERAGRDSQVVALDPWSEALERLRRKLQFRGIENVEVVPGRAEALPLADGRFDVVVCNLGIHNFDDSQVALRECERVLCRGGTLLLSTNLSGHMRELYGVYRSVLLDRGLSTVALDQHEAARGTLDGMRAAFAEAGLEVTRAEATSFRMRFADGTAVLSHWFIRLAFLPAWATLVPKDERPGVLGELEARLNSHAAEAGELELTVPGAIMIARKPCS